MIFSNYPALTFMFCRSCPCQLPKEKHKENGEDKECHNVCCHENLDKFLAALKATFDESKCPLHSDGSVPNSNNSALHFSFQPVYVCAHYPTNMHAVMLKICMMGASGLKCVSLRQQAD